MHIVDQTNWEEIEIAYIAGETSGGVKTFPTLKELAETHGVNYSLILEESKKRQWGKLKKLVAGRLNGIETIEEISAIIINTGKLDLQIAKKLELAAEVLGDYLIYLQNEGDLVFDATLPKSIGEAVKTLTAISDANNKIFGMSGDDLSPGLRKVVEKLAQSAKEEDADARINLQDYKEIVELDKIINAKKNNGNYQSPKYNTSQSYQVR
jgi:hypothetical protein